MCIKWLERDIERLNGNSNFLIGAIEKLSLIPALVGLYIAYEKITDQDPIDNTADLFEPKSTELFLTAFILGIYSGAFLSKR